jgi:hypothetical protein
MVDRKVVPFDEFYYQLKLMYLFLLHVVYRFCYCNEIPFSTLCLENSKDDL